MWTAVPRLVGAIVVFSVSFACASGGARLQDPNVITAPELARSGAANAYDAIRRLRPEMLRSTGSGALTYFAVRRPVVAVDNTIVGGLDVLRTLNINHVARIESVGPWQAAKRYGSTFGDGVVLVTPQSDEEIAGSLSAWTRP
jgi:hypothetical protein